MEAKKCGRCGAVKPLDDFHRNRAAPDGFAGYCKPCWNAYYRERRKDPVEREAHARRVRAGHYRRRYGITIEDYDRMLAGQGGVCAICGEPPTERNVGNGRRAIPRLAVDHCHDSGKVRGLLCAHCNKTLHKLENMPDWIERAATYLKEST